MVVCGAVRRGFAGRIWTQRKQGAQADEGKEKEIIKGEEMTEFDEFYD